MYNKYMNPTFRKTRSTRVCKRPYDLSGRRALSDRKRLAVLVAVRKQLASQGFLQLTMEGLAREAGITRQTVHNLFGTKTELLEALFDQLAAKGGMRQMSSVMRESDPGRMLTAFVHVFCGFWARDRLLLRRIHGIAAIDPEFAHVLAARNQRRWMAATRVVEQQGVEKVRQAVAKLYALTSFEFFDVLAETCGMDAIEKVVQEMVATQLGAGL
jgi:AcrR family transcriptional regulator